MMIAKILMQLANVLMVIMVYHVNFTFFEWVGGEMHRAYALFSSLVVIGSMLSLIYFLVTIIWKTKRYERIFPYDSIFIFVALTGTLVTAIPF